MKDKKDFSINLYQLDNKQYTYEYLLNTAFFDFYPESLIENAEGEAQLVLDKSPTMMQLHFDINARIELVCDVSLKAFWHPIHVEKDVIIKFGDEDKELSEDVRVIHMDTQQINIADYLYEFASLEIPMKKVHPDLEDAERPDMAYTSSSPEENTSDEIDPRWEALKKLKD